MTRHPGLAELDDRYFRAAHSVDPFNATMLGVTGFDDQVPDPSRTASADAARRVGDIERAAQAIDADELDADDRVDRDVLVSLAGALRRDLEHGSWEANASADGYGSPQGEAFMAVPTAPLTDAAAVEGYLRRLGALGGFFDAVGTRYRQAAADGRRPTKVGVAQALEQLAAHLAGPVGADVFQRPALPADVPHERVRARIAETVEQVVHPAMRRLAAVLDGLAPDARGDDAVGLSAVPGGSQAYLAAVRRHTTTDLTPEQVHDIGHEVLAGLREQWLELGGEVLGTTDVPSTLPSADGSRPGAHCVLTVDPHERFTYEYEALAFHESTPGHHLQIASAQTLRHLPAYRRYLDAEVCAYVEGWGLYSERLADEMGLYSAPVQRLGMLSFDALRACRLVVDTGMHHLGWSRQQAVDFMWANTATTRHNVVNEVNRYIAWPGQALAYMVGRREIVRLRTAAQQRLGAGFDVRGFHGAVLSNGAVPLGVLERVVDTWVAGASSPSGSERAT
jgi:uncharacterized protein (DUF885 family)